MTTDVLNIYLEICSDILSIGTRECPCLVHYLLGKDILFSLYLFSAMKDVLCYRPEERIAQAHSTRFECRDNAL